MGDIENMNEAKIDSCEHTFCIGCIKEWAQRAHNNCPLCKKQYTSISYKDSEMKDVVEKVEDMDKYEKLECPFCGNEIEDEETYVVCGICDFQVAHLCCIVDVFKNVSNFLCIDCSVDMDWYMENVNDNMEQRRQLRLGRRRVEE